VPKILVKSIQSLICTVTLHINYAQADSSQAFLQSFKYGMSQVSVPKPIQNYNKADIYTLSNFQLDTFKARGLSQIPDTNRPRFFQKISRFLPDIQFIFNAILLKTLQRSPEISQNISELAAQTAYIGVAETG